MREPRLSDAAFIFDAYTQDADVARHMVWRPHQTLSETERFIAHCVQAWAGCQCRPYMLAFRDNEQIPVGMLEARILAHSVDIGYVLARRHWGAGLMSGAVSVLVDAALSLPGCFRVQATCDVDNLASARALEKAGFVREGRLERYAMLPNISAEPRPCYMYARFN
ncbi:MAG: GNAT family N-acetyltransferase [Telluria sp.]